MLKTIYLPIYPLNHLKASEGCSLPTRPVSIRASASAEHGEQARGRRLGDRLR
jgi:hypothetical protein